MSFHAESRGRIRRFRRQNVENLCRPASSASEDPAPILESAEAEALKLGDGKETLAYLTEWYLHGGSEWAPAGALRAGSRLRPAPVGDGTSLVWIRY